MIIIIHLMSSGVRKSSGKRSLPLSTSEEGLRGEISKDISKDQVLKAENPEGKSTGYDYSNLHVDHKPHKILSDYDELKLCTSSSSDSSNHAMLSNKRVQRLSCKRCPADRYLVGLVYDS